MPVDIEFPLLHFAPTMLVKNEHEFCQWFMDLPNIWLRFGCEPGRYRTWTSPDFIARVRCKGKIPLYLGIEAKLDAADFRADQRAGTHVVLSLVAASWRLEKHGCPVISAYRRREDGWYRWSLDDDIARVFNGARARLASSEPDEDD